MGNFISLSGISAVLSEKMVSKVHVRNVFQLFSVMALFPASYHCPSSPIQQRDAFIKFNSKILLKAER